MTARTSFGLNLFVSLLITLAPLGVRAQEGAAPGGQPQAAPPEPPPPNMEALKELKLRFEREPQVMDVIKAALKNFKVHPDEIERFRRGAEWKALMPNLELIFNTDFGTNDRKYWDYIYQNKFDFNGGTWPAKDLETIKRIGYTLGARANWSLDRIVFNAEVLDVTSLIGVQEGIMREIISIYFTRRRLLTSMILTPPQSPNEQITEQIRIAEYDATLDALTGGKFSEMANRTIGEE